MTAPHKKWEPEYRFGGLKGDWSLPIPLGQGTGYLPGKTKPKHKAKKK